VTFSGKTGEGDENEINRESVVVVVVVVGVVVDEACKKKT
jgi:hypothetical protein